MDETKDKIESLIEKIGTKEAAHFFAKKWESLAKADEEIRKSLIIYKNKSEKESKRNRILLFASIIFSLVLTAVFVYLYLDLKSTKASYSILPGSVREFDLKYGDVWVNGGTDLKFSNDDSVISVSSGEVFIKKKSDKNSITVNTPQNKVIVFAGNASVLSRKEFERITSLGDVTVFHDKDKVDMNYGSELRSNNGQQSVHQVISPQSVGGFRFGKIAFENEPLPFVLVQLGNFYNIQIDVKGMPESPDITDVFTKDQTPDVVLARVLPKGWRATSTKKGMYRIEQESVTEQEIHK